MSTFEMTYYKSPLDYYVEHIELLELEGIKLTVAALAKGMAVANGRGNRALVVTVGAGSRSGAAYRPLLKVPV